MKRICALTTLCLLNITITAQDLAGDWRLLANGGRMTVSIARQTDKYLAFVETEGCAARLDRIEWNGREIEFRRKVGGGYQWYRVDVGDGFMIGRFANSPDGSKPPLIAYRYHVTGWNLDAFAGGPVVFDILVGNSRARLRIDRVNGEAIGTLKFYANGNSAWEYPEEQITITEWDGDRLAFRRGVQSYTGEVSGAEIKGSFSCNGGLAYPWKGTRAEIMTYGLAPKTAEARQAWQERTRRILQRLIMAGNPEPLAMSVQIMRENIPPISDTPWPARDDDPEAHPQNYTLTELRLTYTLPNWLGGEPITRAIHTYLAKPTTPPPAGLERYPLAVVVNGHSGSAYGMFNPNSHYWYGDGWARRGYAVLAIDIGHRPPSDVIQFGSPADASTYLGYPGQPGPDDLANGNDFHPSIKPAGYGALYTDWEEEGERVWDVMRAIDFATGMEDIDATKIVITGLSLGGEVASYVGALDTRIKLSIPAGYSPDLSVLKYRGTHCWNWSFADIREYIDHSDLFALTALRGLIVQTGKLDSGFSSFPQHSSFLPIPINSAPYASDKQVTRRARLAGEILHFLHPRAHEYQTGLRWTVVNEPAAQGDLMWQVNAETASDGRTLFDYVRGFLSF